MLGVGDFLIFFERGVYDGSGSLPLSSSSWQLLFEPDFARFVDAGGGSNNLNRVNFNSGHETC